MRAPSSARARVRHAAGRGAGRGRRLLTAVVLLTSATALLASACGEQTIVEDHVTPGLDGSERGIDRSPFEMPGAAETGTSTTIPGAGPTLVVPTSIDPVTGEVAVLGQKPPSEGGPDPDVIRSGRNPEFTLPKPTTTTTTTTTTIPPTTTPPTTTTTAPPPTSPIIYQESAITSICGFAKAMRSYGTILTNPGLDLSTVVPGIRGNLAAFQRAAPAQIRASMDAVAAAMTRLTDALLAAQLNIDDPVLRADVYAAAAGQLPYGSFLGDFRRVSDYERVACPGGGL